MDGEEFDVALTDLAAAGGEGLKVRGVAGLEQH
jgi:hypothetical protein